MSAGPFNTRTKYELESGKITYCRAQPEDVAATFLPPGASAAIPNDAPTAAFNYEGPSVRVGGSRRLRNCTHARKVQVQFTAAVPTGYSVGGKTVFPIFSRSVFSAINVPGVVTGTYLSQPIIVTAVLPEITRK